MHSLRYSILQAGLGLLMVTISLFAATQWAAVMLGHQPALGAPLIDLLGQPIYEPWKLFVWWLAFDAQAPNVFAPSGAVAAFGGIASGAVAIGGAAWRASRKQQITTYGSARWADLSDVRESGLFADKGIVLGLYSGRYLRHDGPEHVLAVAPTRSGKGVGLVVPTLLTWPGSAVIHDIKGENWQLTAGWRAKLSHCLLLDRTDPCSARFNPLLEVRKGPMEVRDVQNIADILVDPEGARERRDHWEKTAHALLTGAILHVLYAEDEKTLNPDGKLWIERATVGRRDTGERIGSAEAERIIRLIAAHVRREVTDKTPIVSAELPETGERFEGVMPPVSPAPCFAVRKPADVLYRLGDYVAARIMSVRQAEVLAIAVRERKNILVVGGTSSGKTTLVNALLAEIADLEQRVVILEDTRELKCAAADCVALRTKPGVATLADLVRSTLRLRPDRIIVGEVRGPEALDMLKAWNTGHPGGITTVHANSAPAGLLRLEQLVHEAVVIDDDRRIDPDRSRHRGGRPDYEIGKTSSVVESNQALASDDDKGGNADLGFGPCDCPGSSTLSLRFRSFPGFPIERHKRDHDAGRRYFAHDERC